MSAGIDFLRPVRSPLTGWVLLALGVAALIGASLVNRSYRDALVDTERIAQAQAQANLDRQRLAAKPPALPSTSELRLRQAYAESRLPWLATLRVIEATTQDPVYLRSLGIEPGAGVVKLEAEAPSFAEALEYTKALDGDDVMHPALLSSHEQVADPATGKSAVRFSVVAQWNSR